MREELLNLDWERGESEEVIAVAEGDDGMYYGVLAMSLDTTDADRANGYYPWNAIVASVDAYDVSDAEDQLMGITDENVVEDIGGFDTRTETLDAICEHFDFDWEIWQYKLGD